MAGVAYPSDTAAGLELGQQVGKLFVAYAKTDGSDAVFDPSTMPTGTGHLDRRSGDARRPDAGSVEDRGCWTSADQFRPAPPPDPDSPERAAEIAEIKNYERDVAPFTELWFWPQDPAGRPGAGLGPLLQQPGRLLLRPGAPFPVGTGAGPEAVRVPVGHQPAAGSAGLRAGQHRRLRQHRGLLGRPSSSTGRRAPISSTRRSPPSCRPTRSRTTPRGMPRAWRPRPRC